METVTVFDKSCPNGKQVELPQDFVQELYCEGGSPLEPFLSRFSPLDAHSAWVYVRSPNAKEAKLKHEADMNLEHFQAGLYFLKSRGDKVTVQEVDAVAHQMNNTSGKWKVFVDAKHLEGTWNHLARAVHSGNLKGFSAAKVSTRFTQLIRNRGNRHTVYVYMDNYLDKVVKSLFQDLKDVLKEDPNAEIAHFKPDVYSYLGWGSGTMPSLVPQARYTVEDFEQS